MEEWQKDLFEMIEAVAYEVEQFLLGVTEMVDTVVEQVQNTMAADIDQCLQELFEPIAEIYLELEEIIGEVDQPLTYIVDTVEPTPDKNPACIGCHHYHGQAYGGNLLVCAMHPYGWDDGDCPDWGSPRIDSPNSKNLY